ncbi:Panacea domain-containing protein [Macrococcus equi]|uniref:Panacea domain-containing protein n=1 Tax=Macrococcus equi TaxID=3395462 RepID=UPI0039BE4BA1
MYDHFLLITPFHKIGHRIAWHKLLNEQDDFDYVEKVLNQVEKKVGDLNVSSHIITTESMDVESIKEKDLFFKDIVFIEDEKHFIDSYKSEIILTASDVATFIISHYDDITHLKLQKLLYLCYEDFLLKTGAPLFEDKIYAFPYGPVIKSVYDKYSNKGREKIDFKEDNTVYFSKIDVKVTPSFSKIIFSEAGTGAMKSILETLKNYINYSAYELVDITHKKGSPWSRVYKKGFNREITPQIIEQSF